MVNRAALANISNIEIKNGKHAKNAGKRVVNNKDNFVEQVGNQFEYIDIYDDADEDDMDVEIPAHVVCHPLSLSFLSLSCQEDTSFLSQYILELSLLDYAQVSLPPSLSASAALYLSLLLQEDPLTPLSLPHYSSPQLLAVVRRMAAVLLGAEEHCLQAVRTKYSALTWGRVAALGQGEEHRLWDLLDMQ